MNVKLDPKQYKSNDMIDILALLKKIWTERKLVIKVSVSFFFIGCFVALFSPVIYTSQTTFVPQVSGDDISPSTSKIGSLASIAGLNLNSNPTGDSYLSPLLYTKIADSEEFSLKLLEADLVNLKGEKFTIGEYLLSRKSSFNFNPLSFIKKYTIGLFLNEETSQVDSEILENYNFISKEKYSLANFLRQKFEIELNQKEGYIKVLAKDKDAFISSQLVQQTTKILQSKIIEIRTNKIKERLEFSKEQYELKQAEFDILQQELAEFKDSNKSISTARFLAELEKLESEYLLQQNILINLASEYNKNKIKLNKDTPIFSVIDEVSVPNVKSEPNRGFIVTAYLFLGFVFSLVFIVAKEPIINIIKELQNKA